MRKQRGFTLHELVAIIIMLFSIGISLGLIWVAIHFIVKFW